MREMHAQIPACKYIASWRSAQHSASTESSKTASHIKKLIQCNWKNIWAFLSKEITQVLVQFLIISRLQCYNSLLASLPLHAIWPLHWATVFLSHNIWQVLNKQPSFSPQIVKLTRSLGFSFPKYDHVFPHKPLMYYFSLRTGLLHLNLDSINLCQQPDSCYWSCCQSHCCVSSTWDLFVCCFLTQCAKHRKH